MRQPIKQRTGKNRGKKTKRREARRNRKIFVKRIRESRWSTQSSSSDRG